MSSTNFDIIVIGLGPAGIMATYSLYDKGYRVLAIDRGKPYILRDSQIPFDVANGFGGAGLFSDGKLSFFPAASNLWSNLNRDILKRSYSYLESVFDKIGYTIPKWQNNWTVHKNTSHSGKRVKRYRSQYISREMCDAFVKNAYLKIEDSILLEREVISVVKMPDGTFQVFLDHPTEQPLTTNGVVLATGKVGNTIIDLFENVSFDTHVRYEGGVRVETDVQNFRPYDLKQVDYKYIETIDDSTELRTFCCCKDGQVLESDYLRFVSYNGSITPRNTGRSNIGITIRVEDDSHPIANEIKACVKREEKFSFDYNKKFNPNIDFMMGNTFDAIMLDRLGLIIKNSDSRHRTKIYGPEIEYFGRYPDFIWESLSIPNEKIWIAGDLSAKYRGIIAALVSGIYVANCIANVL